MNGKQLRYITAIAETGSIRGGAELLGKDASTMARTLKKMDRTSMSAYSGGPRRG